MRVLEILLGVLFLAGLVFLSSCGPEEAPVGPTASPTDEGTGDTGTSEKEKPEPGKAGGSGEGEKTGEGEPEEEGDTRIPFDRIWPNDPRAREFLLDPEDNSFTYSYWKDAKVGDWVRFMNHRQNVILYKVIKREGDKIQFTVIEFKRSGEEIPEEKLDVREAGITKDNEIKRGSLLNNPYNVRTIWEWELYGSDKIMLCERRNVANPRGDDKETCYNWDVRCGGYVFQRSGRTLVILMVDYGDAEHPPKWGHLKDAELLKYWYKFDRFLDEKVISQEDPEEGEDPEKPEEPAPAELDKKLKEVEKLAGKDFSTALEEKRFKDAADSLEKIAAVVGDVQTYAVENNFKPALAQVKSVSAKAGELRTACDSADKDKASKTLVELRGLLDRLYISVHYVRDKKR